MRTLAARVGLATALAVAGAGLTVALVSTLLAQRLVLDKEDQRLEDAASTLAVELAEPGVDPLFVATDETRELAHTGIAIAIYERGRLVAGDARVPAVASGTCVDVAAESLRACAVPAGRWVAVAGRNAAITADREQALVVASGFAVLVTTLLGAVMALGVARIVLAPLSRLQAAVERVPEDHPGKADLGPSEGVIEIDALRASLERALDRLDASLTQSRRFSRDAAHELRTPLTTILGELDLAAERMDESERDHVDRVRRVAERLATLVERLLILSRVDGPTDTVEDVELLDVVESAIDALSPERRARVTVQGAARVRGDRALLEALVGNALENALKFSADAVRVAIDATSARARIAIEDRGPGVPPTEREQVFGAFYRGADARISGVPGHGVGLALIAHVVAMHGGAVRFAEASSGARLEIDLPPATT